MKTYLVCIIILIGAAVPVVASLPRSADEPIPVQSDEYYQGWKAGWAGGWKKVKGEHSYPPYPPYPPYPKPGRNNYRNGYEDGFVAGMAKALER